MNSISSVSTAIQQIILQPAHGIVGLVDDLLAACADHRLQLEWQGSSCRLTSVESDWTDVIELPVRKSVFRAILARVAALCNEQRPDTVSPYGREADMMIGSSGAVLRAAFVNTVAEQTLLVL
jgi:hypothetical protein